MRVRGQFCLPDLITDAARPEDTAPEDNLGRYVRALAAAGYVAALPYRARGTSLTSNGYKIWVLRKNTGPLAPILLSKIHAIRDRNTGEDVSCSQS